MQLTRTMVKQMIKEAFERLDEADAGMDEHPGKELSSKGKGEDPTTTPVKKVTFPKAPTDTTAASSSSGDEKIGRSSHVAGSPERPGKELTSKGKATEPTETGTLKEDKIQKLEEVLKMANGLLKELKNKK